MLVMDSEYLALIISAGATKFIKQLLIYLSRYFYGNWTAMEDYHTLIIEQLNQMEHP